MDLDGRALAARLRQRRVRLASATVGPNSEGPKLSSDVALAPSSENGILMVMPREKPRPSAHPRVLGRHRFMQDLRDRATKRLTDERAAKAGFTNTAEQVKREEETREAAAKEVIELNAAAERYTNNGEDEEEEEFGSDIEHEIVSGPLVGAGGDEDAPMESAPGVDNDVAVAETQSLQGGDEVDHEDEEEDEEEDDLFQPPPCTALLSQEPNEDAGDVAGHNAGASDVEVESKHDEEMVEKQAKPARTFGADREENPFSFIAEMKGPSGTKPNDEIENDDEADADDEGEESGDEESEGEDEQDGGDDEDSQSNRAPTQKKDRSAAFRAMLEADRARLRARGNGVSALVEDEASEEELEDGVGDYGDGAGVAAAAKMDEDDDEDAIDREMARDGLRGIVDTYSDDEGENNEDEFHAQMLQADDAIRLNAVARAVRSHNFRGRRNRRGGFSRLDQFMDADDAMATVEDEEMDEEEAYAQRLEDERRERLESLAKTGGATASAQADNASAAKRSSAAADVEAEYLEAKAIMERAKMQRELQKLRERDLGASTSFIDKDEDSQAILGMLCRTNTVADASRTTTFESAIEPASAPTKPTSMSRALSTEVSTTSSSLSKVDGASLVADFVRSAQGATAAARKRMRALQRRGSFLSHHNPSAAASITSVQRASQLTTVSRKFVFSIEDSNSQSCSNAGFGAASLTTRSVLGRSISSGGNSRSAGLMSVLGSHKGLQRATKRRRVE